MPTHPTAGRVVVGVALIRDGRLLAARRVGAGPSGGGWELPGGKVEDGESDLAALVREVREELGVTVVPGRPVMSAPGSPDWPLPGVGVLRIWTAHLPGPDQPQPLEDHDQLRWLTRSQAFEVAWLPADRPIVQRLSADADLWPPP